MLKNALTNEENLIKNSSDLTEIFFSGCKPNNVADKIGLEFEKLPVRMADFKAASYADMAGFLHRFVQNGGFLKNWEPVYENGAILGLINEKASISLEPGSQTEISLMPLKKISDIKLMLDIYNHVTDLAAKEQGIYWLGYGVQPVSTYRNIHIIPKKRYEYMTKYLPTVAKKPLVMMRETSGIQASFDYTSEEDAMKKLKTALKLSPLMSAAFANSPVRNGRLTKYKSYRASSWLETDNDRCGLVSSKLFKGDFSFSDYAEVLLDVPMIFIERIIDGAKKAIPVQNLTFRQFWKNGFECYKAEKQDWELHLSLYFPDVRLKSYIEIRNHDNQKSDLIPSIPAFWKGILYNSDALDAVNNVLKDLSYFEYEYLRQKTPRTGLNINIKKHKLSELVSEIVMISYDSLKSNNEGEETFLVPLLDLTQKSLTPADLIIENWDTLWNKDISKLVNYSRLL